MSQALKGIKVVDVSQVVAVPVAARYLGDFGAEVIHVEPLTGDSWRHFQVAIENSGGIHSPSSEINYAFEAFNRNKRGLTLDLSQEEGQAVLHKLLEEADVFLTNLRPGKQENLRVDYATLHERYPRLIHGSVSGVGKNGAERDLPSYDATAFWYRSGMRYALSEGIQGEVECRSAIGDTIAGIALYAGIMTALYTREQTGTGQQVDLSLFNMGVYQMSFDMASYLATGTDFREMAAKRAEEEGVTPEMRSGAGPAQQEQALLERRYASGLGAPMIVTFRTQDGRNIITLPPVADKLFPPVFKAIGREDVFEDPRFATHEKRVENFSDLYRILRDAFLTKRLDAWRPHLNREQVSWAPDQSFREVVNDPQARANDFFVPFDHPTHGRIQVMANPLKLSETPSTVRSPAPELSQHTEEILLEMGYSWEDIAELQDKGVIA